MGDIQVGDIVLIKRSPNPTGYAFINPTEMEMNQLYHQGRVGKVVFVLSDPDRRAVVEIDNGQRIFYTSNLEKIK